MPKSQLFLIDAHALCYRSFYAIKGLSTSKGQATNAIFGVVNTLKKIQKAFNPEYLAVCYDSAAKTLRHEKYAEYKIHRPKMPDELISQIDYIKDIVRAYRLSSYEVAGYEADDIIGTIARNFGKGELDVVIVSDDKDMYQLVNDNVKMFSIRRDKILDVKDIYDLLGFDPRYISDYIGLAGDSTDNIPGVAGIGKVTAQDLITKFGDLKNIFSNLDKLTSKKVRQKLEDQKEEAFFSKELAVLELDVPLKLDLKELKVQTPDSERLFSIFSDLELRKFASGLSTASKDVKAVPVNELVKPSDLKSLNGLIRKRGSFVFVFEQGDSLNAMRGFYVSCGNDEVYYMDAKKIYKFKDVFESSKILKITLNLKDDFKRLKEYGIDIKGEMFDVILAGYLLMPGRPGLDVSLLLWEYMKASLPDENRLKQIAANLYSLYEILKDEIEQKGLTRLLGEIETPLSRVLFLMESQGVKVDKKVLSDLSKESGKKIDVLVSELYKLAGGKFNLNSPKQLSHVMFDKLKLPVVKKTKTGFSTNEEVLQQLAGKHPLPALILEYRHLSKLKSTYIDALPKLVDPSTGKIHSVFDQTGAETGRLSSNHPNLQNIPIRTEFGRQIRKAFVPSDNKHFIIAADYSQIELRVLAHLSKDENLKKAFLKGEDIHNYTAALIFEVKEKDVNYDMRDTAKKVNFSIIYGKTGFGLAKDLNISLGEAQEFIDRYFLRYPKVRDFMDDQVRLCEKNGYVVTMLNRRRYLPEIKSKNMAVRQFAQRQAINTSVQGSAADLIKLAMVRIQGALEKAGMSSKMIITVHDEIIFDALASEQKDVVNIIHSEMEHPISLDVPIEVTIKKGNNWLEMEKLIPAGGATRK